MVSEKQEQETQKEETQEFKLLGAFIEMRNVTNNFGGIMRTDKYFHYAFKTSDGKVVFKEKKLYNEYDGIVYELEFKIGEENKIIQHNGYKTKLEFIMTEEMYNDVFKQE